MNIVLIGFASCGKSATAYEIAKRLCMKFVDLDKEIELRYYLANSRELHYRDIILTEGPEHFFRIEHQALSEISHLKDCVIAPGGGAPLRAENRSILSSLGAVVYLKTAPEIVMQRMQAKGIPLFLRDDASIENLRRIWRARDAVYADMAGHTVDNSHLDIAQTADCVMRALGIETDNDISCES